MLLNSFFFIESIEYNNEVVKASLRIEKEHSIFRGHFPNLPVVPGVCMMQMVREVMESLEGKHLQMDEAQNIKFLAVLDPNLNSRIDSTIFIEERLGDNLMKVSATLSADTTVFFKMKATLKSL